MYNHISNIVSFANLLLFPKMANSENAIIEDYLNCRNQLLSELSSQELWNACNTDSEDNPLFFVAPTRSSYFAWGDISLKQFNKTTNSFTLLKTEILYLIPFPPAFRVNSYEAGYPEPLTGYQQELTEMLPGFIEVPCPPAFKPNQEQSNSYPTVGYQPSVKERYDWTLDLAKRLDAWLLATIFYGINSLSREDKLKTINPINTIGTIVELSLPGEFHEDECRLNWQY